MKTFEERYHNRMAARAQFDVRPMTAAELLEMESPPTSEYRLANLPPSTWSESDFSCAAAEMAAEADLRVEVEIDPRGSFHLAPEVDFKYAEFCIEAPDAPPLTKRIVAE